MMTHLLISMFYQIFAIFDDLLADESSSHNESIEEVVELRNIKALIFLKMF